VKLYYAGFAVLLLSLVTLSFARAGASRAAGHVSKTTAAVSNAANSGLDQMLIAKEKTLPEAQKKKDQQYLQNITTADFLEVAADGHEYSKDDMLEGVNQVNLQDFSLYDVKVLPLNDSAAVVTYNAIVRMTVGAEAAPRYQHLSSVWVKQGDQWRLKFQQATAEQ